MERKKPLYLDSIDTELVQLSLKAFSKSAPKTKTNQQLFYRLNRMIKLTDGR